MKVVPFVLCIALLAGCVGPSSPVDLSPSMLITERPDTTFGDVQTGPAAAPDLNATTDAEPRLVAGEWWRIQYTSPFFPDVPELVRVVAAVEPDGYVIGMPHEGWFKEAIVFHAPAFGDVGLDLSYDTHNVRFEPVRFPLAEGATWTTSFGTTKMKATVEAADEFTATIQLDPTAEPQPTDPLVAAISPMGVNISMRIVYDARQHEVVEFTSAFGTWRVVEHGYDYQGWVTIPRAAHTAIDYGTFWAMGPEPPVSSRTVKVEGGFNRLTLLHVVAPISPGQFSVRSETPMGEEFLTTSSGELVIRFYEAPMPDGEWSLEDRAIGVGATYTMGMAYHQYDIRLPDGQKRADHDHPVLR